MSVVAIMLMTLAVYLLVGFVAGVVFAFGFAARSAGVDGVPMRVRVLLVIGGAAVWPLFVGKVLGVLKGGA